MLGPFAACVRLVTLAACDVGHPGVIGNHLGGVAQALHRAGIPSVVASRAPLAVDASTRFTAEFFNALLGEPTSVETAFRRARSALARGGDDWSVLQLHAREADGDDARPIAIRPYRGLLPFRAEHARFFFGRDAERRETLADLEALVAGGAPRLLVVAGASGTGKSSMVLSGALPDLADHDTSADGVAPDLQGLVQRVEHVREQWDAPPLRDAARLLRAAAEGAARGVGGWTVVVLRPGVDPGASLDAALARIGPGARRLIVVDQFEEVFTLASSDEAAAFARRLWDAARDDRETAVILTVRVDFLGRCGELALDDTGLRLDAVAYDEAHRVFVAQMGPEQLRACIVEPARKVGLRLDRGLPERLLADVGAEPGALPLLQYTLDLLWEHRSGGLLTNAAYEGLGGVVGALRGRADALVDGLDEDDAAAARRMLVRLVGRGEAGAQDTRRRVQIADLRPADTGAAARFDAVLDRFVDARLLVRSGEGDAATVEVAHEALIRTWDRLRTWIREDRAALAQVDEVERAVPQYERYGTPLLGAQLGYAVEVRRKHPGELSAAAEALIDDSLRREKRRRRIVVGFLALLVVIGLGFVFVINERRAEAEEALRLARNTSLLATANSLPDDPSRRAHFLMEFDRKLLADPQGEDEKDLVRTWVGRATSTVHEPLRVSWIESEVRPARVALSPSGDRLLVVGERDAPVLFEDPTSPLPKRVEVDLPTADSPSGRPPTPLPAFSNDGRWGFARGHMVYVEGRSPVDVGPTVVELHFDGPDPIVVERGGEAARVSESGPTAAPPPDRASLGFDPDAGPGDGWTVSRDGKTVLVWSGNDGARLLTDWGGLIARLRGGNDWVGGALDADGDTIALVDLWGRVSMYRLGGARRTIPEGRRWAALAVRPDGTVAGLSADDAEVLDVPIAGLLAAGPTGLAAMVRPTREVRSILTGPNGPTFGPHAALCSWTAFERPPGHRVAGFGELPRVQATPEGAVVCAADGVGAKVCTWTLDGVAPTCTDFETDDMIGASAAAGGTVAAVLRGAGGHRLELRGRHTATVPLDNLGIDVVLSEDGARAMVGLTSGDLIVWDAAQPEPARFASEAGPIRPLAIRSDRALATRSGRLILYGDGKDPRPLADLPAIDEGGEAVWARGRFVGPGTISAVFGSSRTRTFTLPGVLERPEALRGRLEARARDCIHPSWRLARGVHALPGETTWDACRGALADLPAAPASP